jgi:hypothetical protein
VANHLIRPATVEDRASCIAIARMYPDTRTFSTPWYSGEELFVDSDRIWVLDDGGVAGFYSAYFHRRGHVVKLDYLAVAITNHGLGTELLEHLQWRVRRSGSHTVIKSKVGRRSRTFWLRNGFDIEDEDRGVWTT